jgi:hypothetical protein
LFVGRQMTCDQQAIDLPQGGIHSCGTARELRSSKQRGRETRASTRADPLFAVTYSRGGFCCLF